jgi:hypothetical protein
MNYCSILLIGLTVLIMFANCRNRLPAAAKTSVAVPDGKYDSEFPGAPVSGDLQVIMQSVKMINVMSFYESFDFSEADRVKKNNLTRPEIEKKMQRRAIYEKPSSGTALVIFAENRRIMLLTCAHIIDSPDTIISYYRTADNNKSEYIQNVSILIHKIMTVINSPGGGEVEILAIDKKDDLALIGKYLNELLKPTDIKCFSYKWGHAEELEWGSFVYLIGFPYGRKMLSTAVVSNPNRDSKHSFTIDATLHRGISGGIILALRDGAPNFELIGIANALSAQTQYYLRPETDYQASNLEMQQPYSGKTYIDAQISVVYGITYAISIETVIAFIEREYPNFSKKGYGFQIQ